MVSCYRSYQKDPTTYGNIVLQVNSDDIMLQVAEYALTHLDIDTVEIKLGQAAKGIAHVTPIYDYEAALKLKKAVKYLP